MISLDTETTGLDLYHGAKPFLVTICDEQGENTWWEWEVDPVTRQPRVPPADLHEINDTIAAADLVVLQNPKFDYRALCTVMDGRQGRPKLWWDWGNVRDTLLAGHLLASNQPHDLTTMAMVYLGVNIQPLEDALKAATQEARNLAKREEPSWRIARPGLPDMPSVRESSWKLDLWLPRTIAESRGYPSDHPWRTVASEYANGDSTVTLPLYAEQMKRIEARGLDKIYRSRLEILAVAAAMESRGVSGSRPTLVRIRDEFKREAEAAKRVCVNLAAGFGHDLVLPKSGNNKSLRQFVFNVLGMRPIETSKKTGEASLNARTVDHWIATLPPRSRQLRFFERLKDARKRDTAVQYMDGYERFWIPLGIYDRRGRQPWFCLHPSLNPTGTDTLRWSSQNPNEQNISKQDGFNLRECFGPIPGRVWYSLDYENLELRIPAYESREKELIYIFEHPDEPPYFGSYHLVVSHVLHRKEFELYGKDFKKRYVKTLYQWVKNGNFAVIYGAQRATADRAYHVDGAYDKIRVRFPRIAHLNDSQIEAADRLGYVETMPDRTVDPERGYPLMCSRTAWGKVLPTVPLNYHVQGTACWIATRAMVECQRYLDEINRTRSGDYGMVMQVHDELVFDFPSERRPGDNLPILREIKRRMEGCGDDVGVPTPVSCDAHAESWGRGEAVRL